jgi:hypothetical protein
VPPIPFGGETGAESSRSDLRRKRLRCILWITA